VRTDIKGLADNSTRSGSCAHPLDAMNIDRVTRLAALDLATRIDTRENQEHDGNIGS